MANHPSSLKRNRQSQKRALRNASMLSKLHTLSKKVAAAQVKDQAQALFKQTMSALHKAAQGGVIHRRAANRQISRIAARLQRLG